MHNAIQESAKRALGVRLAEQVTSGMVLGVGTGSTAAQAVAALGDRIRSEGLRLSGVPTSLSAERLCRQHGVAVVTLDDILRLDLAFDGADQVDPNLNLIKGRGGAHAREKVVAAAADRFVVLADASKRVAVLGSPVPVPVEVIPMALGPVSRTLEGLGARTALRTGNAKDGPTVTDQGLWIVDAYFESIDDPRMIDQMLSRTPGVLDHGLFLDLATEVWFGEDDGTIAVSVAATR